MVVEWEVVEGEVGHLAEVEEVVFEEGVEEVVEEVVEEEEEEEMIKEAAVVIGTVLRKFQFK